MTTWIRGHLGLLSLAALVLAVAMASSATAALVITGKNIKDGTVTTKDVKDGTLKVSDLSGKARQSLESGPSFVGSACTVPGGGSGSVVSHVAANGTINLVCRVPAAPAQNGDLDKDGYLRSQECNDSKSQVHPGATEINGNLVDDDCDGTADSGLDSADHDADGFAITNGDCDDTATVVYPGANDSFGDGIDNDCDGVDG